MLENYRPQFPLNLIVDIEGGLAQLVFLVDHFLNVRDEAGTVVGEADTPFNPAKSCTPSSSSSPAIIWLIPDWV